MSPLGFIRKSFLSYMMLQEETCKFDYYYYQCDGDIKILSLE